MISATGLIKRVDTVDFPAAPEVVVRLSRMLSDMGVSGEALADVLALDAGVSARVLRLANSVYFRGSGIRSIEEAVLRVGVDGVRDVVFALSLVRAFKPLHFNYHLFWRHGLAVAQAVLVLQKHALNITAPLPELYAAGLLHDVGMLVLDRTLGSSYGDILTKAHDEKRQLYQVERDVIGTDHADAGGSLLEAWKVNTALALAVGGHHDPLAHASPSVKLVHLGDFVANFHGVHHGTGWRADETHQAIWDELGISERELPAIQSEVAAGMAKADAILSVAR